MITSDMDCCCLKDIIDSNKHFFDKIPTGTSTTLSGNNIYRTIDYVKDNPMR